ncbi:ATP-dependent nuclease [Staphylococcus equorum]|uniref:ATP-dependent nuclease n=1 Tax=Staphylococcus equorum TaxID=246432 RepID=UPI0025521AA0|nr:AAA family ATPase [Staphylococcus equorum]MDK9858748.1 AAA family ATPase [Staphylococcus equorum]MDK9875808.1 AAA family ATPase [Staphylococcus equorum]
MKLKKFSVENYKVFKTSFEVEFMDSNSEASTNFFNILTGKNNMGKSTFLEAISEFFKPTTAANKIPADCFNNINKSIILKATFLLGTDDNILAYLIENELIDSDTESLLITLVKTYTVDKTPGYSYVDKYITLNQKHIKEISKFINDEEPYYIRPHMTTEEIDKIISNIYSDAITTTKYEKESLEYINNTVKEFITKLKTETDSSLKDIENRVSETLNTLFVEQDLKINISGGNINSFSIKDLLKNTDTRITVSSNNNNEMLLSEQGTGVQRMSLIYTIQNIIGNKVGYLGNRMLLVDEPEAFLHPEAIRGLSNSLYEIGNSMPIIITTHSPILINLEQDHTVIDIFKIDNSNPNAVTLYNSTSHNFDEDDFENMKILNYVDPFINEFFFSSKNIIVEGTTEKMILAYIQKKYNTNFHIIEARGKTTIKTIMKILNQFDTTYYVLHDLDNVNRVNSELKKQLTNCKKILDAKNSYSEIFAINHTFEAAFYDNTVDNSIKIKRIFKILYEDDFKNKDIKKTILGTFNHIFSLDISELEFGKEYISQNVISISNSNDLEGRFSIASDE